MDLDKARSFLACVEGQENKKDLNILDFRQYLADATNVSDGGTLTRTMLSWAKLGLIEVKGDRVLIKGGKK